jgi:hypothetical protein
VSENLLAENWVMRRTNTLRYHAPRAFYFFRGSCGPALNISIYDS